MMIKRPPPPLLALRAFENAGRLGTMTAAAEELCVTPGAVSRQVRQLEQYLGVDLFMGSKHKPVLTPQGKELLDVLSISLKQIYQAVDILSDSQEKVLKVSCLNSLSIRWLIPRLSRFNEIYPSIEVKLSTTSSDDVTLSDYDVVIGVCKDKAELSPKMVILFPELLGPVISPSLAKKSKFETPSDVCNVPILQTNTRLNAWETWCKIMNMHPLTMQAGAAFSHYFFSLEASRSSLGACITPHHLVDDDLSSGRLIAPFGFVESGYIYTANIHSEKNEVAINFVTWLSDEADNSRN